MAALSSIVRDGLLQATFALGLAFGMGAGAIIRAWAHRRAWQKRFRKRRRFSGDRIPATGLSSEPAKMIDRLSLAEIIQTAVHALGVIIVVLLVVAGIRLLLSKESW